MTLSKSALVEAGEARMQQFEQQSFQFGGHHISQLPRDHQPGVVGGLPVASIRYGGSQPALNGVLDFPDSKPPVPKLKPKIKLNHHNKQSSKQHQLVIIDFTKFFKLEYFCISC